MTSPITILGVCGSLREPSCTRHALDIALAAAKKAGAHTSLLAGEALMLPLCAGQHAETAPEAVQQVRVVVAQVHGLLIGSPEYCGTYSAVIKNLIEWLSPNGLSGKVVGIVTVAEGMSAAGSAAALQHLCLGQGAWVVPVTCTIPRAGETLHHPQSAVGRQVYDQLTLLGSTLPKAMRRLRQETI